MVARVLWILLMIGIGLSIYVIGASMIRKFNIAPPPDPDPTNTVPVAQRYRCGVCGAEVTMTLAAAEREPEAPRHCREDMEPVPGA